MPSRLASFPFAVILRASLLLIALGNLGLFFPAFAGFLDGGGMIPPRDLVSNIKSLLPRDDERNVYCEVDYRWKVRHAKVDFTNWVKCPAEDFQKAVKDSCLKINLVKFDCAEDTTNSNIAHIEFDITRRLPTEENSPTADCVERAITIFTGAKKLVQCEYPGW